MRKLAKNGIQRTPSEDTRAFLQRVASDYPQRSQLAKIVEIYNRVKYGREGVDEVSIKQLRELVNAIN